MAVARRGYSALKPHHAHHARGRNSSRSRGPWVRRLSTVRCRVIGRFLWLGEVPVGEAARELFACCGVCQVRKPDGDRRAQHAGLSCDAGCRPLGWVGSWSGVVAPSASRERDREHRGSTAMRSRSRGRDVRAGGAWFGRLSYWRVRMGSSSRVLRRCALQRRGNIRAGTDVSAVLARMFCVHQCASMSGDAAEGSLRQLRRSLRRVLGHRPETARPARPSRPMSRTPRRASSRTKGNTTTRQIHRSREEDNLRRDPRRLRCRPFSLECETEHAGPPRRWYSSPSSSLAHTIATNPRRRLMARRCRARRCPLTSSLTRAFSGVSSTTRSRAVASRLHVPRSSA